jgi:hypothetical protein
MKCVEREIFERRKQPDVLRLDTMVQRSSTSANGAVADPNMIQIGVDLKPNPAAVTRTLIGLLHFLAPSRRLQTATRPDQVT